MERKLCCFSLNIGSVKVAENSKKNQAKLQQTSNITENSFFAYSVILHENSFNFVPSFAEIAVTTEKKIDVNML